MASLNKAILAGALQRDTELRYTTRGEALAELQLELACPSTSGETTIVPLEARGDLALSLVKLRRGQAILVQGNLCSRRRKPPGGDEQRELMVAIRRLEVLPAANAPATGDPSQ